MGAYYFLLNDTKKEKVHYDHYIKQGPITSNETVHKALINYMFNHQGHACRLVNDAGDFDEMYNYKEINLKEQNNDK